MVHVAYTPICGGSLTISPADVFDAKQSERWLLSELSEVADHAGMEVHVHARRGSPARELAAAAVEHSADALVVGTSASFRRYFSGSVPTWLANRARCPIIVVS